MTTARPIVTNAAMPVAVTGLTLPPLHRKLLAAGEHLFREVKITLPVEAGLRKAWAMHKRAFMERGFGWRQQNNAWYLQQWLLRMPDGSAALTDVGVERLAKLDNPGAQPQLNLINRAPVLVLPDLPHGLADKLKGYQVDPARQIYRALSHGRDEWGYPGAVDFSEVGLGKAQPLTSKVLTPSGFVEMGSLRVGDEVIAGDGTTTRVLGVYHQGVRPVWRVTMSDGTSTRCCDEHLWLVTDENRRLRKQPGVVLPLHKIRGRTTSWQVPLVGAVEFEEQHTPPLDAYLLGVMIGDGCLVAGTPRVSLPDFEMVTRVTNVLPDGVELSFIKGSTFDYNIIASQRAAGNIMTQHLSSLGLMGHKSHTKRVPLYYLTAGIKDRHALLQGLLDTDGSPSGTGVEFCTTSPQLAKDVAFLAQSLGGTARLSEPRVTHYTHNGERRAGRVSRRVYVCLPDGLKPFRLTRKADKLKPRTKYPVKRAIVSIAPDGEEACQCIAVEHLSHLYVTDDFIVTHNTYMDLAAALATGRRVGVLCPTVGENGWRRAFAHFGAEPHFVSTYEAVRGGFRPNIATVDGAGKFTWKHAEDLVLIYDEAQALRHEDTLTVKCCSASIRQGVPMIVASATIALSPIEMRFAGRITGLHKGGDDWPNFLQNHGCLPTGRGGWKWDQRDHHLARINARLFPMRGARVRRQDLGDECPETVIRTLPFDVPEAAKIEEKWQQTQEMLERMAAQLPAGRIEALRRTAHMKVWAECEMALVPYLAERARSDIGKGMSVAIFMNFNPTRIRLGGLLKSHAGFYGGVNKARRKYYEEEFQADRLHLLISNIKAGGASVSLHDIRGERQRRAYICMSDDAIKIEQALGRIDRVGGKSVSEQFLCYIRGARTEQMVVRTRKKMHHLSKLNDGHGADGARF